MLITWLSGSPDFAILRHGRGASWIALPTEVTTGAVALPRDRRPVVEFRRRFQVPKPGLEVRGWVRAFRGFEVELNGQLVAARSWKSGNWKTPRGFQLTENLVQGENLLRVRVTNPSGPALLQLRIEAPGFSLASDTSWQAQGWQGGPLGARLADDTLRAPATLSTPTLGGALVRRWVTLLGLLVLSGGISIALRRGGLGARLGPQLLPLLGLALGFFWLYVFWVKAIHLPAYMGFDGPDHLAYIRFLLERRSLPLASDGAMMYHPPLFYALSAGLLSLAQGAADPRWLLRIIPFLSGLSQLWLARELARRLYPGDRPIEALAMLFAALLPMNLYMSAYLSNEPLHAALAGGALLVTVALLLAEQLRTGPLLLLGVLLSLAVLTKVSSLILVPSALFFLAVKAWLADRSKLRRVSLQLFGIAGLFALGTGWFFLRNLRAFGKPLLVNWELPGVTGWQPPGFHTPAYYLSFGEALWRPFFSSFVSFWDGMYSTFWGDGMIGGLASWSHRHPLWDYDLMLAVFLLALPASEILGYGFLAIARDSIRETSLRRRVALAFIVTTIFLSGLYLVYLTLRVPMYAMTKAVYALFIAAPLALVFARGLAELHRRLDAAGLGGPCLLLHAWAGTLAGAIMLSFAA